MYSYGTRGGTWSGAKRWVLVGVPQEGLIESPLVVPGLSVFLSMLAGWLFSFFPFFFFHFFFSFRNPPVNQFPILPILPFVNPRLQLYSLSLTHVFTIYCHYYCY